MMVVAPAHSLWRGTAGAEVAVSVPFWPEHEQAAALETGHAGVVSAMRCDDGSFGPPVSLFAPIPESLEILRQATAGKPPKSF